MDQNKDMAVYIIPVYSGGNGLIKGDAFRWGYSAGDQAVGVILWGRTGGCYNHFGVDITGRHVSEYPLCLRVLQMSGNRKKVKQDSTQGTLLPAPFWLYLEWYIPMLLLVMSFTGYSVLENRSLNFVDSKL